MARRQDRDSAASAAKSAIETGRKLHETTLASAEVIALRTAMGAQALTSPSFEAAAEAGLMVTEKADAAARSGAALAGSTFEAAHRTAGFFAGEMAAAGRDASTIAASGSPMEAVAAQQQALLSMFGRFASHGLAMGALALRTGAEAVEPFHTASTRNAKRLRKPR